MLYPELKAAFAHVPKTAGSSIRKALEPWAGEENHPPHISAEEFALECPEGWFSFGVVRNPFDRMVSYYHYGMRKQLPHPNWSFPEFIEWVVNGDPLGPEYGQGWNEAQRTQCFNLVHEGRLVVDNVLQYETLVSDWHLIQMRLGIKAALPWENISRRGRARSDQFVSQHYTPALSALVASHFAEDFEAFGYWS